MIVLMILLSSCTGNSGQDQKQPDTSDITNDSSKSEAESEQKSETEPVPETAEPDLAPPTPVGDEPYMLSDILMLKITKNYISTCSYEFERGSSVPFEEIINYYTFDGCFSFDERTLSEVAIQYYDEETMDFSIPSEIVHDFLTKRFNTVPNPEATDCYNAETDCYEFSRHLGSFDFDAKIYKKNYIEKNVYEFSVDLTYSLDPTASRGWYCTFTVELNENGYTYLSFEQSEKTGVIPSDKVNPPDNCRLIVNGKEIPSGNFARLITEYESAELPLITIMRELGAEVTWKDDTTVTFTYNGANYDMDVSKPDFGLPRPPGSAYYFRAVVAGEIVIDDASARGIIAWMGAQIKIDVDEMVIEIA